MQRERPRILFYVQHLLGIGHLVRANRVAAALRDTGFHVGFVTGGLAVDGLATEGIEHIELPPIAVHNGDFSRLVDGHGQIVDADYRNRRRDRLLAAFRDIQPHIVMLEAFPFGRRQCRFELLPLIEALESTSPRPLLVSSIRDIVQRRSKPGRDEETVRLIRQHFDKVLVHGDPQFASLNDSFALAGEINDKIEYTGWVGGAAARATADNFDIVVSAGGGAVGNKLVRTAVETARLMPESTSWCVITGPNLPAADFNSISSVSPANVQLNRFRPDFPALLAGARLSVSQAGYNTVSDVLHAGCHCLLVPYSASGETEQLDRALRLKALGLAIMIHGESLECESLELAIRDAFAQGPRSVAFTAGFDGAERSASILRDMLDIIR